MLMTKISSRKIDYLSNDCLAKTVVGSMKHASIVFHSSTSRCEYFPDITAVVTVALAKNYIHRSCWSVIDFQARTRSQFGISCVWRLSEHFKRASCRCIVPGSRSAVWNCICVINFSHDGLDAMNLAVRIYTIRHNTCVPASRGKWRPWCRMIWNINYF